MNLTGRAPVPKPERVKPDPDYMRAVKQLPCAIRAHDSFATEQAWEKCERWLGAVTPETSNEGQKK